MLIDRIEFDLRLVVEALLTVGSGRLEAKEGGEEGSIAEVHRDADKRPCIPATTIKGALLARWTGDKSVADALFGKILDRRADTGVAGSLLLYAATLADAANAVAPAKRARDDATFDRPATAIDRNTGAAADNKLFAQRAVAAGAVFDLHGKLLCDLAADADPNAARAARDKALDRVAAALAPLATGISVGKGTRQGYGRLRLAGVTRVTVQQYGADGYGPEPADAETAADDLQTRIVAAAKKLPAATKQPAVTLEIHAPGPFLILDPSAKWSAKASTEGVETHVNVHYLACPDGVPVLWPSSFLGALRSRAAWLLEIERLQTPGTARVPRERDADTPVDDRFLENVFDDRRAVLAPGDLRLLTPVERLFGVPGWRGLLEIARLECRDPGQRRKRTSIAIDRLTGGGKDGALFTVEAVEGSRFEIDITLDRTRMTSGWQKDLAEHDAAFFKTVIDDLVKNGLMLGHGAARGYGWFTVAQIRRT
ncbi:MAG: RAMP superfamily CRISPR-associated protein [Xanthobacteraceae bacterium]